MGFGQYSYNGRGDSSRPGIKRYNNSQTAHVWNAQTERRGQSNNGNFYFEGAALYSYGSHFLVGFIMPDGVALMNGDSYSISTSGHQSDARSAVRNRDTFTIADLTELRDLLAAISRGKLNADWKRRARQLIRTHAEALAASRRYKAGASDEYEWLDSPDPETGRSYRVTSGAEEETAGEYLTRMAGLPAASWPKLQREAAEAKAKREKAQAKAEHESKLASARKLADMSDSDFRRLLSVHDPEHVHGGLYPGEAESRLKRLALNLLRGLKTANAEGFSKRRRETLKRRRREVAERLAVIAEVEAIARERRRLWSDIHALRSTADEWRERVEAGELPAYHATRNLEIAAESAERLAESPAFPSATRQRLAFQARRMKAAAERLRVEYGEREAERREAERKARELELAEYRQKWLAGEVPFIRPFDADSGGAALRINGNRLETSHGAEVPLREAIRAFRFIKLVRSRGEGWQANGERVRVGAFHVDSISPEGNMKAGCHSFTWPEIQRAAELAGVVNDPPSAEAVRETLKESA